MLKGSVEVNETTTGRKVKLQPNERLFGKAGQLRKESISEWNRALWMQGILYFDNTRMDEIIRQLGLYYDVKFILEKESLANVRFTGKFRIRDGVEHVLKVLQLKCKFKTSINFKLKTETNENIRTKRAESGGTLPAPG